MWNGPCGMEPTGLWWQLKGRTAGELMLGEIRECPAGSEARRGGDGL